jgi:hypothetical protein
MTALYVPGVEETDTKKIIRSAQLIASQTATNSTNIATNTAAIAAAVVGPGSATNNGFAVFDGTTGKLIKDHAATIALASEVSGTLPVANGGTNYTGGAWTTWTPTVTSGSGTFTTVSAAGSFLTLGKACWLTITITITAVGTAAGAMTIALPTGTAKRAAVLVAVETANVGLMGFGRIATGGSTIFAIERYDNSTYCQTNNVLTLSGVYELA